VAVRTGLEQGGFHRVEERNAVAMPSLLKQIFLNLRRNDKLTAILSTVIVAVTLLAASPDPPGNRKLLESRESEYNNIYVYAEGNYHSMTFGFNRNLYTESIYNTLDDRDLPVAYTRFMTASLMYPKKIQSILEIGFGGGRTAWYLHRFLPDVSVTSVELDPTVLELSRKYFGIKDEPNFQVVNSDGRLFLSNSTSRYDIILIDAYRGPFVPFHLLTKEFYQIVSNHLAEGGTVAQNVEPSTMLFDSAVKTIGSVFPQIDFYLAEGNVVTIAYDGAPLTFEALSQMAQQRQAASQLRYALFPMLTARRVLASDPGVVSSDAKLLTDDFAPVESLKAIQQHNRKWSDK
jgi:spermidine synthase